MSDFPPRQRLARVVRSLTKHLPPQLEGLLEHPRFADDASALTRLSEATHLESALDALAPEEAAWLADLLSERWERLGPVVMEPEVAILAPEELWLGREPVRVPLTLTTEGLEPDWEAVWEGAVVPGPPGPRAVLLAHPPSGPGPAVATVRARVRARAEGQRCVLLAHARVCLRTPTVVVSDDRRRLMVQDQNERPASGVRLEIGTEPFTTGAGGLVELPEPAPPGASLRVEGVPAGRIPGG